MVERRVGHSRPRSIAHHVSAQQRLERAAALLSELRPFWREIYADAHGLLGLFSGRRDGRSLRAPREIYFLWPGGAHFAAGWMADEVARMRDVYQCAHLLRRPVRRKEHAAPVPALYVDLDHAELVAPAVPGPSVVVESSPGRLQCYWQLQEPVDPARGETLNRRSAHALGADRSG